MKGVRFYEEYLDKRKTSTSGNVIATNEETRKESLLLTGAIECLASVHNEPNSPVASSHVSEQYLRSHCKRISEDDARRLHPQLFERLDEKE